MSNWKNVNNWTSKNCISWAKDYLKTNLINISVEHEGITVKTLKVTECNGDAELNQRKGKLIPIYDLVIDLTWSGTTADGTEVTGNIKIPELLQGSETDYSIKQVVRKHLTPLLIEKFKNIGKDMVETHSKDVYIEPSQLGVLNQKPLTPSEPIAVSTPVTTTNISEIEMQTSADQIYETLLDPGRVTVWTRSRPDIFRLVGSKFNLFDGNITGTILELIPNEKIVQTWRLKSWTEDHFSTVTLRFEQSNDHTVIHLTQEGIPVEEVDTVQHNWENYYWNAINSEDSYEGLEEVKTVNDFVHLWNIGHLNLFKIQNYLKKSLIAQHLSTIPSLSQVEAFLMSLTNELTLCKDTSPKTKIKYIPYIKYLLLNPSNQFKEIVQEARSVILAGGTMEPVNELIEQLFPYLPSEKIVKFSC
ncbi:4371_t:CDS:10, partial [Entrophospora sp. SA101]